MPRATTPPLPDQPGSLIITLLDLGDTQVLLNSVELLGNGSRLAVTLTQANRIDEVLAVDAFARLARLLARAPQTTGTIARDDITLRLKELALGGLRMTTLVKSDGRRQITLSFASVYGNLMSLFNRSVDVANAVQSQSDRLADAALNTALLPLFNFADFLENANDAAMYGDRARLYRHLSATRERIRELELFHETLVQMSNSASKDRFEGLPPPGTLLQ